MRYTSIVTVAASARWSNTRWRSLYALPKGISGYGSRCSQRERRCLEIDFGHRLNIKTIRSMDGRADKNGFRLVARLQSDSARRPE